MIFLQGSPELENINGVLTGRLSGITAHHIPKYLQKNRLPSLTTALKTGKIRLMQLWMKP